MPPKKEVIMPKVTRLTLPEVLLLEYPVNQDSRSIFHITFSKEHMLQAGIENEFVEEITYHPMKKNTVYGIHFQNHPKAQTKLLYCTKGRILDFAVDLRKASSTYRKWVSVELNADNKKQLYIPAGFGHAALTLDDDTTIVMRIDNCFDPSFSRTVQYNDPALGLPLDVINPVLSPQDIDAPLLKDCDINL